MADTLILTPETFEATLYNHSASFNESIMPPEAWKNPSNVTGFLADSLTLVQAALDCAVKHRESDIIQNNVERIARCASLLLNDNVLTPAQKDTFKDQIRAHVCQLQDKNPNLPGPIAATFSKVRERTAA